MAISRFGKNKAQVRPKFGYADSEQQRAKNQSQYAKYINQAREAASQGDTVEAERFFQSAEHYARLMNRDNDFARRNNQNQGHNNQDRTDGSPGKSGTGGAAASQESDENNEACAERRVLNSSKGTSWTPGTYPVSESQLGEVKRETGEKATRYTSKETPNVGKGDSERASGGLKVPDQEERQGGESSVVSEKLSGESGSPVGEEEERKAITAPKRRGRRPSAVKKGGEKNQGGLSPSDLSDTL